MRTIHRLAFGLACALAIVPSVSATTQQTRLQGTVRDESGGVVARATVTATHDTSGAQASTLTDERGVYQFTTLAPGEYSLVALLPGFRSPLARVTVGEATSDLDLTLEIVPLAGTVTVTRGDQPLAVVPQAVGLAVKDDIQLGQRRVSLAEGLRAIPGVFVQNRGNYSESFGVRLTIRAPARGVGIGVRGIQIVQDGIPLTVADGTTQPTNIDLGSLDRAEVIRGPSSVLYGNAAGGVISLFSEFPASRRFEVQPDIQFGSHGYQRQQIKFGGTVSDVGYLVNVSRMKTGGFREHSSAESRLANVVVRSNLSERTQLRAVFNLFDMPFGESPSTLSLDDARNKPESVRRLAIDQGFGEASTQGQAGLSVEHRLRDSHLLRTIAWAMWRNVWNPIPNRIVDLGRTGAGFRSEYHGSASVGSLPMAWVTGLDASYQRDDSLEHANDGIGDGDRAREGALLVDQLETVRSIAPFIQLSVSPKPRWMITGGIRYDSFQFDARDRLLTNGDQSGRRTLDAFSPAAGVTFAATAGLNLYASLGTAYETPTTQELSNRPSGDGGFNPDLEAETLRTFEGGARGLIHRLHLRYDVAAYVSSLDNALVQYQRADEQDFYRNAGESSRKGVEALLLWQKSPRLAARLAYTYQRFRFVRFVTGDGDYSGKREPGAPPHQLLAGITHRLGGLQSVAEYRRVARYAVNNANTFSNWASNVTDLRFTWTRPWNWLNARPFLGVDNVFGERYNGSIVPNAFGNRYYEPAAGREIYAGLALSAGVR